MIIDRYREATIALGYSGDSILNSMSDILMCAIGFLAARRLPLWASVLVVVVLELVPLIVIRDNLALNILMLLAPNDAIRIVSREPYGSTIIDKAGEMLEEPDLFG
jgi:hypothetical protein